MPILSAAQILGIVTLALVISGTVIINSMEESYYCESEDNVKECLRLSGSGLTCYYLGADDITKGDRCTGGSVWEPLNQFLPKTSGTDKIIVSNDCIQINEWCYCNPRGLIANKKLC